MRYFLYRMRSSAVAPNGGDMMDWLYFYKWGRPEIVTFRKRIPHFREAQKDDVIFFVLDDLLIGDVSIVDVRQNVYIEGMDGPVQEIDIMGRGIWEYTRTWNLWDRCLDRLRLFGLKEEVPASRAHRWLETYRDFSDWAPRGKAAVYNPDVLPSFFGIKKK